jgi:endothelin-converting enzyme/putative endopeptidase
VGVGRLVCRSGLLFFTRKDKRDKYEQHIARMLQFIGETPVQAKASAAKILALEIKMSNPRLDRVERRDGRLQYNPMTIAELQKMTPAINWKDYFAGIGFTKLDTVIVSQPKYMHCKRSFQKIMFLHGKNI